jgi:flagellum-specific peptidoglycan hydrolase FlgJ
VRQKQKLVFDYIKHYLPVAKEESRKFNIPVSIILAQGLLESNAGESNIALQARNHFGIKCFSHKCKKGHCLNFSDDSHKDFFLAFRSPEESYRAHSQFLIRGRYARLSRLPHGDYKGWAIGLRRAGYATDKGYAQKLIAIVERLHLHAFD